jgi:hypothetical protein
MTPRRGRRRSLLVLLAVVAVVAVVAEGTVVKVLMLIWVESIEPGAIWALVIVPFLILLAVIVSFFNLPPPIDLLTMFLPLIFEPA